MYYIFEEARNNRISAQPTPTPPLTLATEVQSLESHHLDANSISSESSTSRPTSAAIESDDEEEEALPEGVCVHACIAMV